MKVPFADTKSAVTPELLEKINEVARSGYFVGGPVVAEFEKAFADYCGSRHCIGVGNGTDALTLILKAYGIGPGDEVITAGNSFYATAEAICNVGATPVFADVGYSTLTIAAESIEQVITPRTRAVIPVHLYGQCASMADIADVIPDHIPIIEDACQAHGAVYDGYRAGSLGHAAAFSFYPAKNLGCLGDGGAVVTDDTELAMKVRSLASHGSLIKYKHDYVGVNSRLDAIQAAVLLHRLPQLDERNARRRVLAERYMERLGIQTIGMDPGAVHHLFVARILGGKRDVAQRALQEAGISTLIHYPVPLTKTPAAKTYTYLHEVEKLADQILSLPMFPELTFDQVDYVCEQLGKVIAL